MVTQIKAEQSATSDRIDSKPNGPAFQNPILLIPLLLLQNRSLIAYWDTLQSRIVGLL